MAFPYFKCNQNPYFFLICSYILSFKRQIYKYYRRVQKRKTKQKNVEHIKGLNLQENGMVKYVLIFSFIKKKNIHYFLL